LRAALERAGVKAPPVVMLNDTTATLLHGISAVSEAPGSPVIGFILGTGVNTASAEFAIPKIGFARTDAPQIVVHESGAFANPALGAIDRAFDATTANPGLHPTEKAVSGAYLGPLYLFILKDAIRAGVVRARHQEELLALPSLASGTLNDFLHAPFSRKGGLSALFDADETEAVSAAVRIGAILSERAGLFAAALVAGTVEHVNGGTTPESPIRIAVEGTTFLRFFHLREALEAHLHAALFAKSPRFYLLRPVEQASLLGAAFAAASG
jgi:hexokinase